MTMKDKQPIQEKVDELWEWCDAPKMASYPSGKLSYDWLDEHLLENLFEYAVPKLVKEIGKFVVANLLVRWVRDIIFHNEDPALSLFRIIHKEVIHGR